MMCGELYGCFKREGRAEKEMRTPEVIFELIIKTANEDDNILAVYYGGSGANPAVTPFYANLFPTNPMILSGKQSTAL